MNLGDETFRPGTTFYQQPWSIHEHPKWTGPQLGGASIHMHISTNMALFGLEDVQHSPRFPLVAFGTCLTIPHPVPETTRGDAAVLAKILRRATLPEGVRRPRHAMQVAKQIKMERSGAAGSVVIGWRLQSLRWNHARDGILDVLRFFHVLSMFLCHPGLPVMKR